jgi:hypothetical protein
MKTNTFEKLCGDPEHWVNVLLFNECWKCEREKQLLAERPHLTAPTDAEIDEMALQSQTEHEAYLTAN